MRLFVAGIMLLSFVSGCSKDTERSESKLSMLGETCTKSSDCAGQLRCVKAVCRLTSSQKRGPQRAQLARRGRQPAQVEKRSPGVVISPGAQISFSFKPAGITPDLFINGRLYVPIPGKPYDCDIGRRIKVQAKGAWRESALVDHICVQDTTLHLTLDDPMCPRPTRVDEPAKEDMYYPFAEAYKAALMDDGEEAFLRFDAQFEKQSDAARLERKRQYWPRIRNHVRNYVPDPDAFSFEICRVEEKNGGVMRITVRSHVRSKSHTPSRVRNVDGSWKFTSFSY